MTEAGLNTVNLSELNTWQQIMMFLLIIIGSAIFVSSSILHVRKKAFENKFAELAEKRLRRRRTLTFSLSRRDNAHTNDRDPTVPSNALRGRRMETGRKDDEVKESLSSADRSQTLEAQTDLRPELVTPQISGTSESDPTAGHIKFSDMIAPADYMERQSRKSRLSPSFFEGRGVGARRLDNHPRNARPVDINEDAVTEDDMSLHKPHVNKVHKYIDTVGGYLGRNSQFHHLSEQERRKLGGIEYDAICLLSWLVPAYFICFQLFGALGVGAWLTGVNPNVTWTNGSVYLWELPTTTC